MLAAGTTIIGFADLLQVIGSVAWLTALLLVLPPRWSIVTHFVSLRR